jgi:hypothetical protein
MGNEQLVEVQRRTKIDKCVPCDYELIRHRQNWRVFLRQYDGIQEQKGRGGKNSAKDNSASHGPPVISQRRANHDDRSGTVELSAFWQAHYI